MTATSAQRIQEQQNITELERRRHNNRTLPEERPTGSASPLPNSVSSTSISNTTSAEASTSTATTTATNGLAPVGHVGATTAGYGPLPSGWGKLI